MRRIDEPGPGERPDIPIRRFGKVPAPPAEARGAARAPRTIAEYGATAVFLAALGAAAVAGWLLYAR